MMCSYEFRSDAVLEDNDEGSLKRDCFLVRSRQLCRTEGHLKRDCFLVDAKFSPRCLNQTSFRVLTMRQAMRTRMCSRPMFHRALKCGTDSAQDEKSKGLMLSNSTVLLSLDSDGLAFTANCFGAMVREGEGEGVEKEEGECGMRYHGKDSALAACLEFHARMQARVPPIPCQRDTDTSAE